MSENVLWGEWKSKKKKFLCEAAQYFKTSSHIHIRRDVQHEIRHFNDEFTRIWIPIELCLSERSASKNLSSTVSLSQLIHSN